MAQRWILNSAVITAPGTYTYTLISLDEMRAWLDRGPYQSTIGYKETAQALAELSGRPIPVDRRMIKMAAGDEALVFRLTCRLDDPRLKGQMGPDFVRDNCEIGILRREA